jgi:hypothetical protein
MYEHRHRPLLSHAQFLQRLALHAAVATGLLAGSWLIGILGYHYLGDLPWIDAQLDAAMILGGMGQVDTLHSPGSKLFASVYALYCGVVFLASSTIVLAPMAHRMLHRFHLEPTQVRR